MSEQQRAIELEMRLSALEFLVCRIYASLLRASASSNDQISAGLNQIAEYAKSQMFPGLDPAFSDLASDEFSLAVKRLADLTRAMVERLSAS
jgi:hypothetical protein